MSLILSLDLKNLTKANEVINKTHQYLSFIKIGHVAISNFDIKQLETFGIPIMLDLKFFDIAVTIREAIFGYAKSINDLQIFTISSACQDETIKISLEHSCNPYFVMHLSSDTLDINKSAIIKRVEKIISLGGQNFICPPFLIKDFRENFKNAINIATPGIRNDYEDNDHSMTISASVAKKLNTNYIIVGRPIYNSNKPNKIAKEYYDQFVSI
ncbi:MAG: orotidine 5'-phosphate decarboxylase / HUMPS family protein [Candidatus Midichloriaceae bacterium]